MGARPAAVFRRSFVERHGLRFNDTRSSEDFEPELGFGEFMGLLRTEEYDPDRIYDVWERMSESPELRALMDANEETGVCAKGYRERR